MSKYCLESATMEFPPTQTERDCWVIGNSSWLSTGFLRHKWEAWPFDPCSGWGNKIKAFLILNPVEMTGRNWIGDFRDFISSSLLKCDLIPIDFCSKANTRSLPRNWWGDPSSHPHPKKEEYKNDTFLSFYLRGEDTDVKWMIRLLF
jgi:hypothetical protein